MSGKKPKTIGYLRVSTADQDLEKNKLEILTLANNKDFGKVEWVEEKVSGTKSWKERKIKNVIDTLGEGDRIIVPELSRLGRSMLEIMEMLSISKEKGIYIYAVKGRMGAQRVYSIQGHGHGLFHCRRNRTGPYQQANHGSLKSTKGGRHQTREAKGSRKIKAR
jgi:hypothetical protein